jgi:hypothetical protein
MAALPPDLDRLGHALTVAAVRNVDARHRRAVRRRMAGVGVIGALVLAALMPSTLDSAHRVVTPEPDQFAWAPVPVYQAVCGQPRGAHFTAPRSCEVLHPAPQAMR